MATETHPADGHAAHPKPAVWPWLLVPVVALALFFTLRAVRSAPDPHVAPAHTATADAVESAGEPR